MNTPGPLVVIAGIGVLAVLAGLIFQPGNTVPISTTEVTGSQSKSSALPLDTREIGRRADDIPLPLTRTGNELVKIELTTEEVVAEIMPGVTYKYWTYNGTVPGPFIRVKEGDDVEITIHHGTGEMHDHSSIEFDHFASLEEAGTFLGANIAHADTGHDHSAGMMDTTSTNMDAHAVGADHAMEGHSTHSIDLHAVIGPGGGATLTQVGHDGPKTFRFKALRPGIYVYHCASPHVPTHIANGMYGLILVEPKAGMAPVDQEFYVMQGELYTTGTFGEKGHQAFDKQKMLDERPTYFVYNGRVGSLSGPRAMRAKVGDTIRMYVGVGSHIASNLHLIGGIFDKLYADGAIVSPPLRNVQTTIVPAGGAIMVEFTAEVPGTYYLVDHSLTRAIDKGALAELIVEGEERPELFRAVE